MGRRVRHRLRARLRGAPPVTAAGAAGYIGARIAALVAGPGRYTEGAAAERTAQARWLAERLDLAERPAL